MRPSLIRRRLSQNQPARIACMYYPTTMMPAHAAKAGFDAIWLDSEHSTWERHELQRLIAMQPRMVQDGDVITVSHIAIQLFIQRHTAN